MLTAQTTAMMQRIAGYFFTDLATITRLDQTDSELGTPSTVPVIVATNVPCRVITTRVPAVSSEVIGQRESLQDTVRIELATSQTVDINYQITVNSIVYDVVGLEDALTSEVFTQVVVTRHR